MQIRMPRVTFITMAVIVASVMDFTTPSCSSLSSGKQGNIKSAVLVCCVAELMLLSCRPLPQPSGLHILFCGKDTNVWQKCLLEN